MAITISSETPLPMKTCSTSVSMPMVWLCMTTARRAASRPFASPYPWAVDTFRRTSSRISGGASNPKAAGLPVFSLRMRCPAASRRIASSRTGPRIS